jgi:hypothetical protein
MRGEQRKIDGLKRGQQPIFGFLEHANSTAMDVAERQKSPQSSTPSIRFRSGATSCAASS